MYSNIGGMIKTAAAVFMWIGIVASGVAGTLLLIGAEIAYGIGVIIVGPAISWFSYLFMFGFGELIDKTAESNAVLLVMQENQKRIMAKLSGEEVNEDDGYAV
ncbi:MAG: hypothetical protein GX802_05700 [Clostridiales bacterium]|nr:hypothetical protein [Clostridiales bacterium]